MVLLNDVASQLNLDDPEERRTFSRVPWEQYEALLATLGAGSGYRVSFLDGALEILAPSRRHESGKTRIGTLLEIYFLETDTEYFPMGSTTLRRADLQAGGELDESYCMGTDKAVPDLAIEVVVTSGGLDRLELYGRLGVAEVWFWQNDALQVYGLEAREGSRYRRCEASGLLPRLNLALLTRCIQMPSALAAAKAFREGLQ